MSVDQLTMENGDYDLTSAATVLSHIPDALNPVPCMVIAFLGDGAKNLDGTGGTFSLELKINGIIINGAAQQKAVDAGITRLAWISAPFIVPAGDGTVLEITSPNGADTDVDVTVYLFDIGYMPLIETFVMVIN